MKKFMLKRFIAFFMAMLMVFGQMQILYANESNFENINSTVVSDLENENNIEPTTETEIKTELEAETKTEIEQQIIPEQINTSRSALYLSRGIGFLGLGTKEEPYLIENSAQLYQMPLNLKAHYKIINDIDLNNEEWIPIGTYSNPFSGSLDGNGYKIKNINIKLSVELEQTYTNVGFFGVAKMQF